MSMHGMTKEEYLASRTEENIAKRKALGIEWKEKFARLIVLKRDCHYTDESMKLTERLMDFNSDCYTIWNFRRLILLDKVREANEEQARQAALEVQRDEEEKEKEKEKEKEREREEELKSAKNEAETVVDERECPAEEQLTKSEGDEAKEEEKASTDEKEGTKEEKGEGEEKEKEEKEEEKEEKEKEEEKKEEVKEEEKLPLEERLKRIGEAKVARLTGLFERELDSITSPAIRRNPKSYWPWNHRVWCIQQLEALLPASTPPTEQNQEDDEQKQKKQPVKDLAYFLKKELGLCELFLKLDGRNFHCWNYRSFIAEKAGVTQQQELEFTETKIGEGGQFFFATAGGKSSFSNYSAWHLRSKVLGQVWGDLLNSNKEEEYWQSVDEEFRLLEQSLVMHDGESPWQYHRWLMTKVPKERKEEIIEREFALIDEIIRTDEDLTPNKPPKWAMLSKVFLLQELAELKGKDEKHQEETRKLIAKLAAHDPFRKDYYAHLLAKYQKAN